MSPSRLSSGICPPLVSPVCSLLSHPFSLKFGYLLSTLLCRTRAAPGIPARTRTRANPHHARAHALVTLPSGPATALYTMGPAHAPATGSHLGPPSITSPPQVTPPRRPHPHRSPQPSRDALPTRHDSLRHPQAVAAHHEPTMTARSQPARSGSGLALLAPASRAAHTGPDRRTPPPAPHASRCHRLATPPATAAGLRTTRRLPRPGKLLSTMLTQGLAIGAGRPPRVRMDPSLQGHHSLSRALTSAHPHSSITSSPQITPPRRPHPQCSPLPSWEPPPTRHDSLRPQQAVAAYHKPTMTARSHPARSGLASPSSHRCRGPHTGPDRRTPPPVPHASRCHRLATPPAIAAGVRTTRRLPRPGKLLSTMLTQGLATGAGRPPRVRMDPSLQGHHSLGSVGDPPLQGHHALMHRGILRCSVQIRCQTNYISPSMRSQQVQVGPD